MDGRPRVRRAVGAGREGRRAAEGRAGVDAVAAVEAVLRAGEGRTLVRRLARLEGSLRRRGGRGGARERARPAVGRREAAGRGVAVAEVRLRAGVGRGRCRCTGRDARQVLVLALDRAGGRDRRRGRAGAAAGAAARRARREELVDAHAAALVLAHRNRPVARAGRLLRRADASTAAVERLRRLDDRRLAAHRDVVRDVVRVQLPHLGRLVAPRAVRARLGARAHAAERRQPSRARRARPVVLAERPAAACEPAAAPCASVAEPAGSPAAAAAGPARRRLLPRAALLGLVALGAPSSDGERVRKRDRVVGCGEGGEEGRVPQREVARAVLGAAKGGGREGEVDARDLVCMACERARVSSG